MMRRSPEALEYQDWPGVNVDLLSEEMRERFLRLKSAIEAACDGKKSGAIGISYGVKRAEIFNFLNRCTAVHPDGRLWGYRALVKGCRQKPFQRRAAAVQSKGDDGAGLAGAFMQMLELHPKVKALIFKAIGSKSSEPYKEAGLNQRSLHQSMIKMLKEEGVLPHMYPFNTKNCGYTSMTKYIRALIANGDHTAAAARYGSSALDGLQSGTGKKGILQPRHPLEIVAYDEQKLPFIGTLVIEIDGKEIDIPIRRGYLCLLVSMMNGAILGYSISVSTRFRSLDLLNAFESFLKPWTPRKLTIPGMRYREGAGLPSGVVPQVRGQRIGILNLDNHLTHLANSVVGHLRRRTGAIIRFGKVKQWIARSPVEGIFAELQKRGFSRLSSTTGSGPDDPAVDDPVGKAVKHKIRMEYLMDIVDVLIANHNALPRRSLMSKTPNEDLAFHFAEGRDICIVPRFDESFLDDPQVAVELVVATVRGSRENGRRPYIQLDYGHYTNDILQQSWAMIGHRLQVHIQGDYRKVRTFREDGTEFGVLAVTGHWANSFHTREMRKEINFLHDSKIIDKYVGDPITTFNEFKAHEAIRDHKKKKQKLTRAAGDLAQSMHAAPDPIFRYRMQDEDAEEQPQLQTRGRKDFFTRSV